VVVNSFQLFPPGSPFTAGLLGMKTVFALQFPLSGSQVRRALVFVVIGYNSFNSLSRDHTNILKALKNITKEVLSTPSLGITILNKKLQLRLSYQAFNSLSRDHVPDVSAVRSILDRIRLSTPSLGITSRC